MKARPILFSSPMIQALQDGRKTQTRRIVKGVPMFGADYDRQWHVNAITPAGALPDQWSWWSGPPHGQTIYHLAKCPYGVPGDLLIVRETHWRWGYWRKDGLTKAGHQRWRFVALDTRPVAYCLPADKRFAMTCYPGMDRETVGYWKRPSLFMPRTASRLTLEITDVRVERLQDISDFDARAEGLIWDQTIEAWTAVAGPNWPRFTDPVRSYAGLWRHINGPESWAANPWVWVVEFKAHRANVDQVLAQLGAAA